MCVGKSNFSNIFCETTGQIEAKVHMGPPWDGGTKVCSNGPGHMTKMAAMPIYGKNFKIFSSLKSKKNNKKNDDLETWYARLGAQVLSSLFK